MRQRWVITICGLTIAAALVTTCAVLWSRSPSPTRISTDIVADWGRRRVINASVEGNGFDVTYIDGSRFIAGLLQAQPLERGVSYPYPNRKVTLTFADEGSESVMITDPAALSYVVVEVRGIQLLMSAQDIVAADAHVTPRPTP